MAQRPGALVLAVMTVLALSVREQRIRLLGGHAANDVLVEDLMVPLPELGGSPHHRAPASGKDVERVVDEAGHRLPVVTDHRVLQLLEESQIPFVLTEESIHSLLDGLIGGDGPAQQAEDESGDDGHGPPGPRRPPRPPGSAWAKLRHDYGPCG